MSNSIPWVVQWSAFWTGSWETRTLDLAIPSCSYGTLAKLLPISRTQFGHLYSENVGKEFPGSVLVATVR